MKLPEPELTGSESAVVRNKLAERELPSYTGASAHALCDLYESATFEEVHRSWRKHLPKAPGVALDVGAGSGRDAAALRARGWDVVAVDSSADMLEEAQSRHPHAGIEWIHDALPELQIISGRGTLFKLILCSAVWMHLGPTERSGAMMTIAGLLQERGVAVITLRHPPDPKRQMFDVTIEETMALAECNGLAIVQAAHVHDPTPVWGRLDVSWSTVVLRRPPTSPMQPSPQK
jgi:SAM-dependent methyltransferase